MVTFATLLGVAALGLRRAEPETGARVIAAIDAVQKLVLRLVRPHSPCQPCYARRRRQRW